MATFFFCGIGGIGMSAIALYLKKAGHTVLGSDRSFDNNKPNAVKSSLCNNHIQLVPQTGEYVTKDIDFFIVSSAVEPTIPDVKKALELNIKIMKRAEILAEIFHKHTGIAIAGTSGKTTVTAMVGHILSVMKKNPTMINGGISLNTYNGENESNLIYGDSNLCVIEADESDGSIALYTPHIGILTNISLDHKPIEETLPLFESFLNRCHIGGVINMDCKYTSDLNLTQKNIISFSVENHPQATLNPQHICFATNGISFNLNGKNHTLPFIGKHNLENALAATAACMLLNISPEDCLSALKSFKGTKRRLQTVGITHNITIIDDYGHNTEKIKASLQALQLHQGRIFAVYQPHGFAPMRMMKTELTEMLKQQLDDRTYWIMPDIYYAGGTVTKDVSSNDVVEPLKKVGKNAFYIPERTDIQKFLLTHVQSGDFIVIMGARDDTLTHFAYQILNSIKEKKCLE